MRLLAECPYVVQAGFWVGVTSIGGWVVGLAIKKVELRNKVVDLKESPPREVEAHR